MGKERRRRKKGMEQGPGRRNLGRQKGKGDLWGTNKQRGKEELQVAQKVEKTKGKKKECWAKSPSEGSN